MDYKELLEQQEWDSPEAVCDWMNKADTAIADLLQEVDSLNLCIKISDDAIEKHKEAIEIYKEKCEELLARAEAAEARAEKAERDLNKLLEEEEKARFDPFRVKEEE